ncbi:ligand-binding sensor domain-containing diguanylate cyclase [Pseudoduganella rivuli]|nr:ligand-binding sensor domain-containing diguanylate cyclase [Pseudoduganella rivuli]
MLCVLLAASLLAVHPHAAAQTRPGLVSFQRIAIPDDVPAHLTTAAVQDQRGMLWFGTQDGLVRYDGYSYKVFRARPGDPAALGGSYIRSLFVARDGRIWAGTISGGVSVFDPRSERFTQYRHQQNDSGLAHDRVESIAEDRAGMMWLATDDGLDRLDPGSGAITHFRHDALDMSTLASNQVRSVLADREGRLWVGGQDGLQLWQDGRWLRVASEPGAPGSLAGQHITRLMQDARGRIWIGTHKHGAAMLDPARLPQTVAEGVTLPPARELLVRWLPSDKPDSLSLGASSLSHYWVYSMAQAANGEIWIGTFGNGIDVIDPVSLKVVDRLRHDAGNTSSIGASRIGALLSDRSGTMWTGSWGGGIAQHHPATRAFVKIRHSAINPDTPGHPGIVRALESADGKLWLGTNGEGVDVLDADGHVVARHRARTADPGALADGSITCLAQDAQGGMWIATLDGTLHHLPAGATGFRRYGETQGLPGGPIRAMAFGPDGALWVGAQKGLGRIAPGGKATVYRHVEGDERTLSGREVESLAFTKDGTLWVGTENGVNAFDTAQGTAVRIRRDANRADSLPDNWVPDLMVDRQGRLWLATQSGVAILNTWNGSEARFDVVSRRIGLPAQPAESLLEDAQGMVWLNGRTRIDPATWQFQTYGPADGADFRTRYIASRSMTRSGDLLFGSPEGLLIVRPALLRQRGEPLRVVAAALSVAGRDVPGAGELAQLALQAPQRSLRVEFAAQGAGAPDQVRYRYRLEGYDADWAEVDARQRVAAYTGLPPGEYTLRVQAAAGDMPWAATGAAPGEWQLNVTVAPAFYQTIQFRALMWLLGALSVFGLFRLRLRQLRRRAAWLERTVAERTAALETAYRDIEQASLTDPLTGLRNRRFLEQSFQADLDLVARRHAGGDPGPGSDLLLFMLDLDHFKSVNDQYGHAAGDAVLVQAAAVLRQCMRGSDYIVRWGGEEFLLLARFVDRAQGPAMAEKIRTAIAGHPFVLPDGAVLHKTVSIGYAACPPVPGRMDDVTLDSLQQLADTALYAAKRSWRDAWVGVSLDAGMQEGAVRRFLADPAANASEWRVEASRPDGMQWG